MQPATINFVNGLIVLASAVALIYNYVKMKNKIALLIGIGMILLALYNFSLGYMKIVGINPKKLESMKYINAKIIATISYVIGTLSIFFIAYPISELMGSKQFKLINLILAVVTIVTGVTFMFTVPALHKYPISIYALIGLTIPGLLMLKYGLEAKVKSIIAVSVAMIIFGLAVFIRPFVIMQLPWWHYVVSISSLLFPVAVFLTLEE